MKCRMCLDRVANGMKPACVTACPTGALDFGTRDGIVAEAERRAKKLADAGGTPRVYGKDELGGLGVIYVLPQKASAYGLPETPKLPHLPIFGKWLMGVIPGLAIFGVVWKCLRTKANPKEAATAPTGDQ